ncbi:MAG: OmpA family protein, partial [Planctomycetota bacterium]
MSEGRAKAVLLIAFAWIVIIVILAVAYRLLIKPTFKDRLTDQTGSESIYKEDITLAADSFTGYCMLRSKAMQDQLRRTGIKLIIEDDGANYLSRAKALRDGKVQMAVFTIDSLITTGAELGEFPASIVLLIDETKGADAIVSCSSGVASLQDLNDPKARMVLTPNSPSEFLARIVIAHFNLPHLPANWIEEADGAADVFKKMRSSAKHTKKAFVMWEPYVSKALKQSGTQVLIDSSHLKGYIVDVLVAQRKFLKDHPDLVRAVIEAYLRAAYPYSQKQRHMIELIKTDAKQFGSEKLTGEQAQRLVEGIQWKNTLENYAHFGMLSSEQSQGLQYLEDIITNITDVLVQTGALEQDPLQGKSNILFYAKILNDLKAEGFHPGKQLNIINDPDLKVDNLDQIRGDVELPKLDPAQWDRLVPVGELRIKPISFARGTSRLHIQSERDLASLASRLQSWPAYYMQVIGHSRAEGDVEANKRLAQQRARAALDYLAKLGIKSQRMRAIAAESTRRNGSAQSVSFELGQS